MNDHSSLSASGVKFSMEVVSYLIEYQTLFVQEWHPIRKPYVLRTREQSKVK